MKFIKQRPIYEIDFPDGYLVVLNCGEDGDEYEYSPNLKDIPKMSISAILDGFKRVGLTCKYYTYISVVVEKQPIEYIKDVLINMP